MFIRKFYFNTYLISTQKDQRNTLMNSLQTILQELINIFGIKILMSHYIIIHQTGIPVLRNCYT